MSVHIKTIVTSTGQTIRTALKSSSPFWKRLTELIDDSYKEIAADTLGRESHQIPEYITDAVLRDVLHKSKQDPTTHGTWELKTASGRLMHVVHIQLDPAEQKPLWIFPPTHSCDEERLPEVVGEKDAEESNISTKAKLASGSGNSKAQAK
ncbi:hypothetical protein MMC18_009686 [Xylographa bjoerkii]|nr:hypothetical protein [Xylographa bjoerkii]